jgi:hypothetical protein
MAFSTKLATSVADLFGMSETKVNNAHRYLREAGIVSKSGRGISAAQMTVDDCVTLLAAVMGSEHINDSVKAAGKVLALRADRDSAFRGKDPGRRLLSILQLDGDHHFKSALLRLFEITSGQHPLTDEIRFYVRIYYPKYSASISLRVRHYASLTISYGRQWKRHAQKHADEPTPQTGIDLVQMRQFTDRTVRRLAKVLSK